MSEPTSQTEAAGEGVSDEEMVETVAAPDRQRIRERRHRRQELER